jgi:hypothetical protein
MTSTTPVLGLETIQRREIYGLIEQDLLVAIGGLPEKSDYKADDLGRATKGAARGC